MLARTLDCRSSTTVTRVDILFTRRSDVGNRGPRSRGVSGLPSSVPSGCGQTAYVIRVTNSRINCRWWARWVAVDCRLTNNLPLLHRTIVLYRQSSSIGRPFVSIRPSRPPRRNLHRFMSLLIRFGIPRYTRIPRY